MSAIPVGKLPADLLARLLAAAPTAGVALGPALGEDAAAIDIADGRVLVAATDPITLTTSDVGRYSVLVNANDVAVMGVRPRWFLAAVLLPPGTTDASVERLFTTMGDALDEIGVALVGGHTEVTSAVHQPVVVGQMLGVADDGRFLRTADAAAGDVVVQVGAAPIEGAAVLAGDDRVSAAVAAGVLAAARNAVHDPGISVVDAALLAASLGASAMHDPTEGGLASGLHELALAAGLEVRVDPTKVIWFDPGLAVCGALGADPWATLASGALLATFPPDRAEEAVGALTAAGHPASVIATTQGGSGVYATDGSPVEWPARDEVARVLEG